MKHMKYKLLIIVALLACLFTSQAADTNAVAADKEFGNYELTLGGGGVGADSSFGLDVSLSTNPLKWAPNIWFGAAQGVAWEPTFGGSTDLFIDRSTQVYKKLYINTGWFVGGVYDTSDHYWRTGPEVTFEYYIGDSTFFYAGTNYDIVSKGDNGFRYSFGIGFTW